MSLKPEQLRQVDALKTDLQRRFQALSPEFWKKSGDIPLLESMRSPRLPDGRYHLLGAERHTIGNDLVHTVITSEGRVVERLVNLKDDWHPDRAVPTLELGEISDSEYFRYKKMITQRISGMENIASRMQ